MDDFEKLVERRRRHERLMRPRGFNWHRLRLVDDHLNPRARKLFVEAGARVELPNLLEWLLALALAAVMVCAYFWQDELQVLWERWIVS